MSAEFLDEFKDMMRQDGVLVVVTDEFKDATTWGSFSPMKETGRAIMKLRPNATKYEILHEYGHFLDWQRVGKSHKAYDEIGEKVRESNVFFFLKEHVWDYLNAEQQKHAWDYFIGKAF